MFAAIYIPAFGLQVELGEAFETQPAALLDESRSHKDGKSRIIGLNKPAAQKKIEVGMTAAQAQARFGEIKLFHRSPETERAGQNKLLEFASSYTPDFEDTQAGVCLMDLAQAQPGDGWELGWEMVEALWEKHRWRGQFGFAKTPDLAWIIAKHADPVRSLEGDEWDDFLQSLPIKLLEPPQDIAMTLTLWGVATVGDFMALPHTDLADRLGPDALELWERVTGKRSRLLQLVRPPKDFAQTTELDYEVQTLEPLMFGIRRSLETICARLASGWVVAGEILLELHFSNGAKYQQTFRVPNPCREIDILYRILDTHLEGYSAQAPIVGFRLEAVPARPLKRQSNLFESGLRDPDRFADTLARLEGLLGPGRVGVPEIQDSHQPDAVSVEPFHEDAQESVGSTSQVLLGLPLRRFRPAIPVKVSVVDRQPAFIDSAVVRGEVRDLRGPWRSSSQWWGEPQQFWARNEWDVEIAGKGLFRLICEKEDQWKLEGVYG